MWIHFFARPQAECGWDTFKIGNKYIHFVVVGQQIFWHFDILTHMLQNVGKQVLNSALKSFTSHSASHTFSSHRCLSSLSVDFRFILSFVSLGVLATLELHFPWNTNRTKFRSNYTERYAIGGSTCAACTFKKWKQWQIEIGSSVSFIGRPCRLRWLNANCIWAIVLSSPDAVNYMRDLLLLIFMS